MYNHIIIPTDGSEAGTRAVEAGLDLARKMGAKLTILTVVQPFHTFTLAPEGIAESVREHEAMEQRHIRTDDELENRVRASGVDCAHVRADSPHLYEAVEAAARDRGCDLIVMPAHDRYGLLGGRSIDGDTAKLLAHVRMPVLVLH